VRPTSGGFIKYFIIISFSYLSSSLLFLLFLSPLCYLIISLVPNCLMHNCKTSWRSFYFYLLSPLFSDQFPLIPIISLEFSNLTTMFHYRCRHISYSYYPYKLDQRTLDKYPCLWYCLILSIAWWLTPFINYDQSRF